MKMADVSIPEMQDDEILVRVVAASLCGSDLVSYKGYLGSKTEGMAGGHEGTGVVVKGNGTSQNSTARRCRWLTTLKMQSAGLLPDILQSVIAWAS